MQIGNRRTASPSAPASPRPVPGSGQRGAEAAWTEEIASATTKSPTAVRPSFIGGLGVICLTGVSSARMVEESIADVPAPIQPAPATPPPPPAPRHRVWVTVVLSLFFLLIVGAGIAARSREKQVGDPESVLRDVDASLGLSASGVGRQRLRSELASRLRALLDSEASVADDIRAAARVLLAIVLVDDAAPADAAAALKPIAGTPLEAVLRCAFPTLGVCRGTPDPSIAEGALRRVGGQRSQAARRIREGLTLCCSVGRLPPPRRVLPAWLTDRLPSLPRWLLVGSGLIIAIANRRRKQSPTGMRAVPTPWTLWGFWSALVRWASAAIAPFIVAGFYYGLRKRPFPGIPAWINAAWAAWCLLLVFPFFLRPWGLHLASTFGLRWERQALLGAVRAALPVAAAALAGGTVISVALLLVAAPGSGLSQSQGLSSLEGLPSWIGAIAFMVVATPPLEEVAFRGLLFGTLAPRLGPLGAAVASSALFGFTHPYALTGEIVTLWYGLVFCRSYARSGNLMPPILAHAMINLLAVLGYALS